MPRSGNAPQEFEPFADQGSKVDADRAHIADDLPGDPEAKYSSARPRQPIHEMCRNAVLPVRRCRTSECCFPIKACAHHAINRAIRSRFARWARMVQAQ